MHKEIYAHYNLHWMTEFVYIFFSLYPYILYLSLLRFLFAREKNSKVDGLCRPGVWTRTTITTIVGHNANLNNHLLLLFFFLLLLLSIFHFLYFLSVLFVCQFGISHASLLHKRTRTFLLCNGCVYARLPHWDQCRKVIQFHCNVFFVPFDNCYPCLLSRVLLRWTATDAVATTDMRPVQFQLWHVQCARWWTSWRHQSCIGWHKILFVLYSSAFIALSLSLSLVASMLQQYIAALRMSLFFCLLFLHCHCEKFSMQHTLCVCVCVASFQQSLLLCVGE